MAKRYIESMIENAADMFIEQGFKEDAKRILSKNPYSPIMKPKEFHPEEKSSNKQYNNITSSLSYDFDIINTEISNAAFEYDLLIKESEERIKQVDKNLSITRQKRRDIEMLDCSSSIDIDPLSLQGDYSLVGNNIGAATTNRRYEKPEVLSVDGNGIEGNKHVYIEELGIYLSELISTKDRSYLTDKDEVTVYEYSRINVDTESERTVPSFNVGWEEAKCCISLKFQKPVNSINILVTDNDVELVDIETSMDGIRFNSAYKRGVENSLTNSNSYRTISYLDGSGVLCFDSSLYIKIYMQSIGYTKDVLAYDKHILVEEEDR